MTVPALDVINALVEHARPLMLRNFHERSCIAASRLAIEVLGYYGHRAEPVPCRLDVFNPVATEILASGEELTDEHVARGARLVTVEGTGRVGVSPTHGDAAWNGHLVVFVPSPTPDLGVIIDLSLDQAKRPLKDIIVEPTMFFVEPGWRTRPFGVEMNGCAVIYNRIDNTGYRRARDWKSQVTGRAIGQIIRDLRPRIESPSPTTMESP